MATRLWYEVCGLVSDMRTVVKVGIAVAAIAIVVPVLAVSGLMVAFTLNEAGLRPLKRAPLVSAETRLVHQPALVVEGKRHGRSEHGFSQRLGYHPAGASETEWFGEMSDGSEPQLYFAGPLVVVIDRPSASLFVRTPNTKWKNFVLVFPNDLGPLPISFYAEKTGLTIEEVSRIDELGGKREKKYPTTYIQKFDPATRELECLYHVDNTSSWPIRLRLSEDGGRLVLIEIGDGHR